MNKRLRDPTEDVRIRQLVETGLTQVQIASIYKCSSKTIQRKLRVLGLSTFKEKANAPIKIDRYADNDF